MFCHRLRYINKKASTIRRLIKYLRNRNRGKKRAWHYVSTRIFNSGCVRKRSRKNKFSGSTLVAESAGNVLGGINWPKFYSRSAYIKYHNIKIGKKIDKKKQETELFIKSATKKLNKDLPASLNYFMLFTVDRSDELLEEKSSNVVPLLYFIGKLYKQHI